MLCFVFALALSARALELDQLPPDQWIEYSIRLLDDTPAAAYSNRGWNKLVHDPVCTALMPSGATPLITEADP